jgi:hypothetical protein
VIAASAPTTVTVQKNDLGRKPVLFLNSKFSTAVGWLSGKSMTLVSTRETPATQSLLLNSAVYSVESEILK